MLQVSFAFYRQARDFAVFTDTPCVSHHSWQSNIQLLYYKGKLDVEL
jgi:hypothetical protein